jgi:hypothetical protein
MNLYKKNLLFRSHPRGLVHATAVSLVLIGRMWTTCKPKPYSYPLPTPYLSPVPDQGHQESRGGEGEELLLAISCLLCSDRILPRLWSIKYASLTCHIWWVTLLWREHPCRSPRAKDVPASRQKRSLEGRGGGYQGEGWSLVGGGGAGRENACVVFEIPPLWEKFIGPLHLILPTFLFWIAAIINTLVIRSSLKDWQSMKKECTLARHRSSIWYEMWHELVTLPLSFGGSLAVDTGCDVVIFSHLGPVSSSRLIQFFWGRHHGIWTVQKVSQLLFDFRVFSLIFFPCSPISAMFNFLKTREDTVFIAQGWSPVSVTRGSEKISSTKSFFTFRVAV